MTTRKEDEWLDELRALTWRENKNVDKHHAMILGVEVVVTTRVEDDGTEGWFAMFSYDSSFHGPPRRHMESHVFPLERDDALGDAKRWAERAIFGMRRADYRAAHPLNIRRVKSQRAPLTGYGTNEPREALWQALELWAPRAMWTVDVTDHEIRAWIESDLIESPGWNVAVGFGGQHVTVSCFGMAATAKTHTTYTDGCDLRDMMDMLFSHVLSMDRALGGPVYRMCPEVTERIDAGDDE